MPFSDTLKTMVQNKKVQLPSKKKSLIEEELAAEPSPNPKPGEFPGDAMDRYQKWEASLSPEAKAELRKKRAKEGGVNL
jgi:hypothetical protein